MDLVSRATKSDRARDRFRGALLGTMIGDALGAPLERLRPPPLHFMVRDLTAGGTGFARYTDDTEMTIALAEALVETPGTLDQDRVAARFGARFDRRRGYGRGAKKILQQLQRGRDWREVVEGSSLPGGSFGNGAAMRVAPIALAFYPDPDRVAAAAEQQALVTGHSHPIGLFGSRLQALAVLRALDRGIRGEPFAMTEWLPSLLGAGPGEFDPALEYILHRPDADPVEAAVRIGTRSGAAQSVPMALWAFGAAAADPERAVILGANLGGDSDSIAAMTGAIAGAYHGARAFPNRWVAGLENGRAGRDHLLGLADQLFEPIFRQPEKCQ